MGTLTEGVEGSTRSITSELGPWLSRLYRSPIPGARMSRERVARSISSSTGRQVRPTFHVSTRPLWE
jgi:hypothetical protein